MEEIIVDMRKTTHEEAELSVKQAKLVYKLNHTEPFSEDTNPILTQLFGDFGENSWLRAPLEGVCFDMVHIGKNVMIMPGCLMMSRGGIFIDDNVMIAANVQLLTNNHDLKDRMLLICKPIHICKNVWIGAGATILPGITIGENAIVAAASVVTKDVPANSVVAGNPAKVIKTL